MNKTREYNVLRKDYMPLKRQYEAIQQYWGERLIKIGINKQDKRYITYYVRV